MFLKVWVDWIKSVHSHISTINSKSTISYAITNAHIINYDLTHTPNHAIMYSNSNLIFIFTQRCIAKKYKNGKNSTTTYHRDLTTTTARPHTDIMAWGGTIGPMLSLQFHYGEPAGHSYRPKPCAPSEGNSGGPKEGLSSLWPKPLASNDSQRQHAPQSRSPTDQQLHLPSILVDPILPRPNSGGPDGDFIFCD